MDLRLGRKRTQPWAASASSSTTQAFLAAGNIEELSFADWKMVQEVNVDSVFLGTKHALKYLRQNQPGSIINISSIAGLIAAHNSPAYNASKAAVWLLSKGIALHCAKQG